MTLCFPPQNQLRMIKEIDTCSKHTKIYMDRELTVQVFQSFYVLEAWVNVG
jgi:hypothetical protein